MKHLWQAGQRKLAFDTLSQFVLTQAESSPPNTELDSEIMAGDTESNTLLARSVSTIFTVSDEAQHNMQM